MAITHLSPVQAAEKMKDGYTYVDVRTEAEFAEGHPHGAVNVPLTLATPEGTVDNPDFVPAMKALFPDPTEAKVILGCRSGRRSMRAAEQLLNAGYEHLFEQSAGWDGVRDAFGQLTQPGWSRVGLPIDSGDPEGRSWSAVKKRVRSP